MRIVVKAGRLKINNRRVVDDRLHAVSIRVMKEAAKDFVDTLIEEVPVLTGEALGSVLPVARIIGHLEGIQSKLSTAGGRHPNRVAEGAEQGRPQDEAKMFKRVSEGFWQFNFSTKVFHFFLRDQFQMPGGKPTPWQALDKARLAMLAKLNTTYKAATLIEVRQILAVKTDVTIR